MKNSKQLKTYSIAEARDQLARIVHEAEEGTVAELTRRGDAVAVIVSAQHYQQVLTSKPRFWKTLTEFRERRRSDLLRISDKDFEELRDRTTGRKIKI